MFLRIQLTTLRCWLFTEKYSILDAWRCSEYACLQIAPAIVLCNQNKYLMRYFEFLHGSRIICLPLNISETLHWHYVFEKPEKQRLITLIFVNTIQYLCTLKINIYHLNKQGPPTFFVSGYQYCNWPRSGPFCWQKPCSGCNSGIDLVVILKYTLFQLCSNTEKIS